LGWRPSSGPGGGGGGNDTYTLDSHNMASAHWSRAARGYELKIITRMSTVVQLDGFVHDVCVLKKDPRLLPPFPSSLS
jgi:structure-specific recognition protein 1